MTASFSIVTHQALAKAPKYTLWLLAGFHIAIITLSNYLVQIPVEIAGFQNTWGTFSFPLVYIATDLTVRIYGSALARRIIAWVMLPALIVSYGVSVLFVNGAFNGFSALTVFDLFVFRIAMASFSAYLVGQLLDITVFNRLRQLNAWWPAPAASSFFGNAIDTVVFYLVAFYHSDDIFMAANFVEIGIADYLFKITICVVLMLPLYRMLLSVLQRHITFVQPCHHTLRPLNTTSHQI
ncbi:Inner membrane protein YhhQ [invertebrate metagenome]|uniref:Inner membrane protein YhhQ n=1 Tax=invertebrate metagenome TaxID=1711999 RepID=A0A2H9T9R5_9ZZZZ